MRRPPVISATDLASCVFPVPAGPSMSTGLPRRSARYTTPAMPSSARYCTSRSPWRTAATDSNRAPSSICLRLSFAKSPADVAVAGNDVLRRGELPQPHGTAGVQLLRADADLGAEPELLAVGEPGGCIHHDGGSVHLMGEALGGVQIAGDDGLGVPRPVSVDPVDGGAEVVDDGHAHLQVEEL